jgi:hypothetical protein
MDDADARIQVRSIPIPTAADDQLAGDTAVSITRRTAVNLTVAGVVAAEVIAAMQTSHPALTVQDAHCFQLAWRKIFLQALLDSWEST